MSGGVVPVTLPGSINSGDILISQVGMNYPTTTLTWPAGWTKLFTDFDYNDAYGSIAYRIADGTEGSTVSPTGSPDNKVVWVTRQIRGNNGVVEGVLAATNGSGFPDPPTITPSWGSADTLWIVVLWQSVSLVMDVIPSGYGNELQALFGGNNVATDNCYKAATASSDNPSAYTIHTPGCWARAATIAIQPGTGGIGGGSSPRSQTVIVG
jgi:hypothetical protein